MRNKSTGWGAAARLSHVFSRISGISGPRPGFKVAAGAEEKPRAGGARLAHDAGGTHASARTSRSPGWSRAGPGCSPPPAPRLGPELRLPSGLFEQY